VSNHKEVFDNVVRSLKEGGGFANGLEALLKEHNLSDFRVTSIGLQRVKSGPELKCPPAQSPYGAGPPTQTERRSSSRFASRCSTSGRGFKGCGKGYTLGRLRIRL
jgi:hypothetical protein